MKTIYLVRHGKAESGDTGITDFERVLLEKGKKDSAKIAKRLKKRGIRPSLLIASPAVRALETAGIFAKHLEFNRKDIQSHKSMYEQTVGALLEIVRSVEEEHDSVMLIGHNPSIEDFAHFLIKDFMGAIPTCGVVGIECDSATWKEIAGEQGRQILFESLKSSEKPVSLKSLRKDLEIKLAEQISNVLREVDAGAVEKMKKVVKKSSMDIAKIFMKKPKKSPKKKSKK